MEESERDKLVKVLRMFGSNHDGEVAAAARRAHSIIKKHALDWDDLVVPLPSASHQHQDRNHRNTNNETSEAFLIHQAQSHEHYLTEWEREFLESVAGSLVEWGRLTPKQRAVLDRIVNKLKLRGCW